MKNDDAYPAAPSAERKSSTTGKDGLNLFNERSAWIFKKQLFFVIGALADLEFTAPV